MMFIVNWWVVLLKDQKGIIITKAFQNILDKSNRKPIELWVDNWNEFYSNHGYKIMVTR